MYKEEIELSKLDRAHEIMQLFRYHYKNDWVSQAFINKHDRLWIKTFNTLVDMGLIERKKSVDGYVFRWIAAYPE